MSLQGEIQTMPLQDLLQWLELMRKTGTLSITRDKISQNIYFSSGEIATATSSDFHSTDTESSVKFIVSETLNWGHGNFAFDEGEIPEDIVQVNLHLSPQQLVLDSFREMDEAEEARRQGQHVESVDVAQGFTLAEGLRMAIIGRLLKGEFKVPLLPTIVNKIMDVTRRDNYSLRDLSEIILTDQVITAQLLKLANSALYSRNQSIDSVQVAVQHLGAQAVTNLVLALSLQSVAGSRDIFLHEKKHIWNHSLACAVLSRSIAPIAKVEREQAFLCGLMIDFGKFVLLSLIHEMMQQEGEYQTTPKSAVDYIVDTYHPKVGGIVGEKWKLPPAVLEAITCHHAMVGDSSHIRYVAVASLCDAVIMEYNETNASAGSVESSTQPGALWKHSAAARILNLTDAHMDRILELVPECLAYAYQMSA